jgi:hypothetical protein
MPPVEGCAHAYPPFTCLPKEFGAMRIVTCVLA